MYLLNALSLSIALLFTPFVTAETQVEASALIPLKSVPAGLIRLTSRLDFYSPVALVVDKAARVIELWQDSNGELTRVAAFPADIGKSNGDKQQLGDHRTPEGVYFLLSRLEGPNLDFNLYGSRAFTTDYPNYFDRREGKTGSGIWLHAIPDTISLSRGSRGCVVVRNDIIQEISPYIRLQKTPLLINETIQYISPEEHRLQAQTFDHFLRDWRDSWKKKDLDGYMKYYSQSFNSMNMNYEQWKVYKSGLNQEYDFVEVQHSEPVIYAHQDHVTLRTLQLYQSDKYSDFGEKILYLQKESDGYKIVGEDWVAIKSQRVKQEFLTLIEGASTVSQRNPTF